MHDSQKMRFLSLILAVIMVMSLLPMSVFATESEGSAVATSDDDFSAPKIVYTPHDDYYNVISKTDYVLAPGVTESEIVLNNAAGSHRQVSHVVEIDIDNPYTQVIPSTYKMAEGLENKDYKVQIMSQQAAYAEANGYGNVVAAMNLSLSWYDSAYYTEHPELVGEPLGYLVLDGAYYENSQGKTAGAQTVLVINFDEKDGVARPADIPKTEIRATSSAITGWEEQVIPANFGFLVKDGVNQYKKDNNGNNGASRSFVGIKADGSIVMVMNDGRQAPFSTGFTSYEMAEFMLSLGCVQAVNGDGGGSSAFLSQRPGEELTVNCSPSDGAERPTTHGILVISTAPADGQFARANITAEHDYYTPGSTVTFTALGTDLVGTAAEIPADAVWQLADPSLGTIENGVFVSNGTTGTVTAQLVWKDAVVGEASVEIVIPEALAFAQSVMTVPFDKEVTINLLATVNGGLHEVKLKPADITFSTTNEALGTFNGFQFTSVSQENAPEDLTSTLTATLVHNTELVATATLSLGKGSEVLFDFEDPSDIDAWNIADVNGNDQGFYQVLSYATAADGQVHDGVGSMRVEMNPIAAPGISNGGYAQSDLFLDNGIVVENAKSIGFWAYIPDEYEHCWIRVLYWYDSNNDGVYDKKNTVTVINQPEVYNAWDESGWKYFSVDVSAYGKVLIPGMDCKDLIAYNASKNDANNFRFIEFMFPHTNTNTLWQTYGTINGLQTVYVDNITADFSDAVDDREAPIFSKVELAGNDTGIEMKKHETVTTSSNLLTATATVAENTAKSNATGLNAASAKAYVDGVEVPVTFANGRMTISDVAVADGIHRIKFEICDNMGNKAVVVRLVKVASGVDASTVQLVPADPTLNNLYGGSVYWMNMNANKIETIQSVQAVIDLNYGNHFELDHIELADGFTATYTIDRENNTATIVITRTGENTQTGAATIASLPIRVIYFDTDIKVEGYTAETYWNEYGFWPYDLKVDVDMGKITYVEGYASNVIGAFSNEEFSVDTELQAAFSDSEFKAERGTAHVHAPEAVEDQEATCTVPGYTGRTYCAVCDSVVDWGTDVPADGHNITQEDGLNSCADCGLAFYFVDGVKQTGWIEADGNYYYCNVDGVAANNTATIDGHTYLFVDYVLTDGSWEHDGVGLTCWWAGELLNGPTFETHWKTINGKKYYFNNIYVNVGAAKVQINYSGQYTFYYFDEKGVWLEDYDGVGGDYFFEDGIAMKRYQLVEHNGDFYFINDGDKIARNVKLHLSQKYVEGKTFADGSPIPVGTYFFDADGKMELPERKHGVIGDYLYINDVKQTRYKLVEFEGDFYFINDGDKIAKNVKLYLGEKYVAGMKFADGRDIQPGYYVFDAEGKMEIPEQKHGVVGDYLYINDVKQTRYKLVEFEGNFYFINDGDKIAKNVKLYLSAKFVEGMTFADGRAIQPGYYIFDAEGKMEIPEWKNGVVGDYLYINNVKQTRYKLVEFEGNFYFINDGDKIARNIKLYLSAKFVEGMTYADGRAIEPGYYVFDAEGKMEIPEWKNGVVGDYLYINNVKQTRYKLVEFEGDFYFINDGDKIAKSITLYLSDKFVSGHTFADGTSIPAGYYKFGADGKMILK